MRWLAVAAGAGVVALAGILLGAGPAPAAPLAATLALVVATPTAPAARPRAVLAGYALSALAGLLASAVLGLATPPGTWWRDPVAIALGVGLAVALMGRFDVLHPPAAAAGCVVALHPVLDWPVALVVLAGGAAVAGAAAARRRGRVDHAASAAIPARTSRAKISGCSKAAKCPPRSASW